MPGHNRGGPNPFDAQMNQAIQRLPNVPNLRQRRDAVQGFFQAAEGFEQQNPIGAVRFGGVGHGEGHRLNGLRQQEQQLHNGGVFNQPQAERNMRGLMDAEAFHGGVEAQHDANRRGDAPDAHFPGFVALPDGRPNHDVMHQEQAQRGAQIVQMAFPEIHQAHGNVQNVFQHHLQQGGDMDVDPDFEL
ncbi:hypothetical protein BTJ49_14555 [Oleiagrimonas sp. MCCC 1A03011]|nr:hypothetical protein BTJ49_14555 [Oleiagrimonas sp. MCCC 1A03011]